MLTANRGMVPLKSDFLVHVGSTDSSFGRSCYGAFDWGLVGSGLHTTWWQNGPTASQVGAVSMTHTGTSAMRLDAQRTEVEQPTIMC